VPNVESLGSFVDDTVIFQCLRNPIAQVSDEWWDDDKNAVDAFRLFIATSIRIHMINILKCNEDPHITNAPALNEIKTLDYITRDLLLPHNHLTNFANEMDLNEFENSSRYTRNGRSRFRGRGRGRGRGHGRTFGRKC
jgi:hypothetical protein